MLWLPRLQTVDEKHELGSRGPAESVSRLPSPGGRGQWGLWLRAVSSVRLTLSGELWPVFEWSPSPRFVTDYARPNSPLAV